MKQGKTLSPRASRTRAPESPTNGLRLRAVGQATVIAIALIGWLPATLEKPEARGSQIPGSSDAPPRKATPKPTAKPAVKPTPVPTPLPTPRPARPASAPAPTPTPRPKPRPTPRSEPAPLPSLPPSRWPELKTCEFETEKVDANGLATKRRGQARYFTEELSNDVRLEMVAIPEGTFRMGSPESEKHRSLNEGPLLPEVKVPSFFMSRFEVTQAQWRVVSRWEQEKLYLNPIPSSSRGDHRPVEGVLWAEAMEFCARLSRRTGLPYRLPSEAEWEYACRAGTTTPFAFGETITLNQANFGNRQGTTPVGYFRVANAFGLYDMHGNVWEWCLDAYHPSYRGAPTDGSAWEWRLDAAARVKRGGSWIDPDHDSRSARRAPWEVPNFKGATHGFRVVMSDARSPRSRTTKTLVQYRER